MEEKSVKRVYREIRYCPKRPKRWGISNTATITYGIGDKQFNLYKLEKIFLALRATKITKVKLAVKGSELIITSSEASFVYKIKSVLPPPTT